MNSILVETDNKFEQLWLLFELNMFKLSLGNFIFGHEKESNKENKKHTIQRASWLKLTGLRKEEAEA